ncbi:MAG: hypothetical protein RLN75_05950, partial [Longimicrobiales bacterium]
MPSSALVRLGGLLACLAVVVTARPAPGQEPPLGVDITLAEAAAAALRGNAHIAAAEARAVGALRRADAASAFLWPGVEALVGVMRTDDPVG